MGALPGRQVRQGELAERGLAPQEERGDPVEGARGGPRVEVRQQRLRVGQVGQARKGGPALVVDEDETHALGRIAVGDRGEPAQQRLRLARARTAGHEGVRSVRDQVEGHGSRLGSPDDDAEASGNPLGVAGIPVQARGQCVLVIGTRDGPPPPGGHGLLVGDAHARAPRGQVGDASRVADVEDGRGLLVRGRASAGRASFPVGHVDVDALGSQEDGRAGVPPDARPSHLGGHLSRAPQRAFGAVSADDAEGGGIPRLGGGVGRQGDARAEPAGPTGPHGGPPGQWGSARVRKRGEHEGEGRPVPPASALPRASNPRDRAGAREEGDDGGADPQCLRARDEGVQSPGHERTHDDDGDEWGSAQEGGRGEGSPASSVDDRPGYRAWPGPHLQDVASDPRPPASGQARPRPEASPHAQACADPDRRGAREGAQACSPAPRGKIGVFACDARARQGNIPGAAHHTGRENEPHVGTVHARQVEVRSQGRSCQATRIAHAPTIARAPRAFKRRARPCG